MKGQWDAAFIYMETKDFWTSTWRMTMTFAGDSRQTELLEQTKDLCVVICVFQRLLKSSPSVKSSPSEEYRLPAPSD